MPTSTVNSTILSKQFKKKITRVQYSYFSNRNYTIQFIDGVADQIWAEIEIPVPWGIVAGKNLRISFAKQRTFQSFDIPQYLLVSLYVTFIPHMLPINMLIANKVR